MTILVLKIYHLVDLKIIHIDGDQPHYLSEFYHLAPAALPLSSVVLLQPCFGRSTNLNSSRDLLCRGQCQPSSKIPAIRRSLPLAMFLYTYKRLVPTKVLKTYHQQHSHGLGDLLTNISTDFSSCNGQLQPCSMWSVTLLGLVHRDCNGQLQP